jgi:hypothetical protein
MLFYIIKVSNMKIVLTTLLILILCIAKGQSYEFYVSDAGNFSNPPWQILKFDSAGQNPSVFISSNLNWPQDILFIDSLGVVLISNLGTGKITRHNATTGAYISDFAGSIGGPTRMKIGPDSLLYVLQWGGDGLVRKYNLDGTFAGNFTSVPVPQSIGLDWDANNNLYVSSYNGKFVRRFNSSGADMGIFVNSNLLGPTNIWFNDNNELLVIDYNGTAVKKFDSTGAYISDFIQGISQGEGVCFLPGNKIAIGCGATHSVRMYDSLGTFLQDLISSGSGNLLNPNAIVRRDVTNVSVDETKISKSIIIYPSGGSEFHFAVNIQKMKSINLYSMDGKFIQNIPVKENWKAENIDQGYYFVQMEFTDKKILTEKIYITR